MLHCDCYVPTDTDHLVPMDVRPLREDYLLSFPLASSKVCTDVTAVLCLYRKSFMNWLYFVVIRWIMLEL